MQKAGARHFAYARVCWSGRWTLERRASFFQGFCGCLTLFELSPPGTESMFLYPNEFGKVPGEEFDAAVPGAAGLALALCHLVALTILIIAALAQVLKHVVLMEVSYEADLCGGPGRGDSKEVGRIIERT